MALSGTKAHEASLGQYGSIFVDTTDAVTPPADKIICAICFMADTVIKADGGLKCENTSAGERIFMNTQNAANASNSGSEGVNGKQIDETNWFTCDRCGYEDDTDRRFTYPSAETIVCIFCKPERGE